MAANEKFMSDPSAADVYTPICHSCRYYQFGSIKCIAFPNGIPLGILTGKLDHKKNIPGDDGVHWEPKSV